MLSPTLQLAFNSEKSIVQVRHGGPTMHPPTAALPWQQGQVGAEEDAALPLSQTGTLMAQAQRLKPLGATLLSYSLPNGVQHAPKFGHCHTRTPPEAPGRSAVAGPAEVKHMGQPPTSGSGSKIGGPSIVHRLTMPLVLGVMLAGTVHVREAQSLASSPYVSQSEPEAQAHCAEPHFGRRPITALLVPSWRSHTVASLSP